MATHIYLGGGGTVTVDEGLSGDGSSGDPINVNVDGVSIIVNGSNELEATATAPEWGDITGTLSAQTDLQTALDLKAPLDSPTFTTQMDLGADGVRFTASDGDLTILGRGNGTDESLTFGLDGETFDNHIDISSATGATKILCRLDFHLYGANNRAFSGAVFIGNVDGTQYWSLLADTQDLIKFRGASNTLGVTMLCANTGTGNQSGAILSVLRNASGSGAASCLNLQGLDGTNYFLWVDATGDLRIGPAAPHEDGTPSDTSGTVVGTQS